jgi:hypothetical protein
MAGTLYPVAGAMYEVVGAANVEPEVDEQQPGEAGAMTAGALNVVVGAIAGAITAGAATAGAAHGEQTWRNVVTGT